MQVGVFWRPVWSHVIKEILSRPLLFLFCKGINGGHKDLRLLIPDALRRREFRDAQVRQALLGKEIVGRYEGNDLAGIQAMPRLET